MATSCLLSYSSPRLLLPRTTSSPQNHQRFLHSSRSLSFSLNRHTVISPRKLLLSTFLVASSSSSSSAPAFDDFSSNDNSYSDHSSKKSILSNLIQEIEPLDVSLIQKDVPPTTLDAMKRTISGMLGLLPSDHFQVLIKALWDPLSKLLVSSMMTGYTLRNAEFRLCLEKNLDIHEEDSRRPDDSKPYGQEAPTNEFSSTLDAAKDQSENISIEGLGELTLEARQYILNIQSRLSSVKKELGEVKRKTAALQMQRFVGEEKNDLLDYLRSLEPEKVIELAEPASPELKEIIHSLVHGLLATLSPRMHSKAPLPSENTSSGPVNVGSHDYAELVENSLHFQPLISLTRDYLARLLFWCMLLGHYLRGLEYRMELTKTLSLSIDSENDAHSGEHAV